MADLGLKINHPDLLYLNAESKLGVEQSRQIKDFLSFKPFQAKGRLVILEDAQNFTNEAQNALLKTLEELPENNLFLIGIHSENLFLPTILSRCQVIYLEKETALKTDYQEIEKLLSSDIAERFLYIEKLKDRQQFLNDLTGYFHQAITQNKVTMIDPEFLRELLEAKKWADANVNIRGILEYLMLIMPKN